MSVHATDAEISIENFGTKSFLRPQQRSELEFSIRNTEERLLRPDILEMAGGDPATLAKQLAREKRMLEEGTPPDYDGPSLNKIAQKVKKCEDVLTNGMPTHTMMERGRPSDIMHFDAHMNARHSDVHDGSFTTKRADLARKNYLIALEAKSPTALDVNFLSHGILRTDTVRGNPEIFRKNYDMTAWREAVEEELASQIDEETYLLFTGLKALEWSDVNIRRKFDWSIRTFDIYMARWRGEQAVKKNGTAAREYPVHDEEPVEEQEELVAQKEEGVVPARLQAALKHANQMTTERAQKVKKPAVQPLMPPPKIGRWHGPHTQMPVGWPKEALQALGISVLQFWKDLGEKRANLSTYYKFARTGLWPEERGVKAQRLLEKYRKQRDLEPVQTEPELREHAEPVGTSA